MDPILSAAQKFTLPGSVIHARPLGQGNVHDTYLVTINATSSRYVLQRLNSEVFAQPALIMHNMRRVAEHLEGVLGHQPGASAAGRRWAIVRVIAARDGADLVTDASGQRWRMLSYIDQARTLPRLTSLDQAQEAGYGVGRFHRLLHTLPVNELHDTLPDFHITPRYLVEYDRLLSTPEQRAVSTAINFCHDFIRAHRSMAPMLQDGIAQGVLHYRPVHGDPKLDNILFDLNTNHAVALIDLDTVKPGLTLWDIADCLRSCCNRAGEDPASHGEVMFDCDVCAGVLQGYQAAVGDLLLPQEYGLIAASVQLIAFELGLRFFTDFLAGNRYFKVVDPEHNLRRAMVQFRLCASIAAQERQINKIAGACRHSAGY